MLVFYHLSEYFLYIMFYTIAVLYVSMVVSMDISAARVQGQPLTSFSHTIAE